MNNFTDKRSQADFLGEMVFDLIREKKDLGRTDNTFIRKIKSHDVVLVKLSPEK